MRRNDTPGFIRGKQGIVVSEYLDPAQILVISFLAVILVGTILLMLPISSQSGQSTPFIDSLFTATSAVCVTGLVVVNTYAHWSIFGKIVIMLCIQIGGLGFMTLVSMTFIMVGKRITLKNRLIMQEALSFTTVAGIVRFTKHVVKGTLVVEGIGAILLAFQFIPERGVKSGIAYAIFHSVSAFCNAGFDLVGTNSLTPYVGNGLVNFTIMGLIIMGGIGFCVWIDTYKALRLKMSSPQHFSWKQTFLKLGLHTKLVWIITIGLLTVGAVFFFGAEYHNPETLGLLTFKEKIYAALFQSVSPRTAGFNTISLPDLTDASKIMTIILMFIGGSPAGTAGGIKTTTAGILVLCALCTIKGKENVVVFKRKVPIQIIMRALTITMLAMAVVLSMVMLLSFTESATFMEILFEVVSAFGTVGLTLGITSSLTIIGKITIIIAMFIGRLGPITMAVALTMRQGRDKGSVQYPEEKILVG